MERKDAFIALAGAFVLAFAIGGAALNGADGPALLTYAVTHEATTTALSLQGPAHAGAAQEEDALVFFLDDPRTTQLHLAGRVEFTPGFPDASLHAVLRSPTGAEYAPTTTATPAGTPTGGTRTFEFRVILQPEPGNGTLEAGSQQAAEAQVEPPGEAPFLGEWTLTISFSSGTPAPFTQARSSAQVVLLGYETSVRAQAPASR